ncbi:MAG: hypothetical protein ABW252_24980 [Polyangiales bacterium]
MRTTLGFLGWSLLASGCLISGYDEKRAAPIDDASQLPGDAAPTRTDAGSELDIDAGMSDRLDARVPRMDAQLDPPDDDDGGRNDVETWCATHACGEVKQCSGADCALSCGDQDYLQVDAGRGVDCTFDCDGSERCDTTCNIALGCQTSCLGTAQCSNTCKVGASCSVYCGTARCGGTCESGSSCAFACPTEGCDEIYCKAGARCILRCGGNGNNMPNTNDSACKFQLCDNGQQQRCGNGRTVVCGRPCPMR